MMAIATSGPTTTTSSGAAQALGDVWLMFGPEVLVIVTGVLAVRRAATTPARTDRP